MLTAFTLIGQPSFHLAKLTPTHETNSRSLPVPCQLSFSFPSSHRELLGSLPECPHILRLFLFFFLASLTLAGFPPSSFGCADVWRTTLSNDIYLSMRPSRAPWGHSPFGFWALLLSTHLQNTSLRPCFPFFLLCTHSGMTGSYGS